LRDPNRFETKELVELTQGPVGYEAPEAVHSRRQNDALSRRADHRFRRRGQRLHQDVAAERLADEVRARQLAGPQPEHKPAGEQAQRQGATAVALSPKPGRSRM